MLPDVPFAVHCKRSKPSLWITLGAWQRGGNESIQLTALPPANQKLADFRTSIHFCVCSLLASIVILSSNLLPDQGCCSMLSGHQRDKIYSNTRGILCSTLTLKLVCQSGGHLHHRTASRVGLCLYRAGQLNEKYVYSSKFYKVSVYVTRN